MKKNSPNLKSFLTDIECIEFTRLLANSYFTNTDDGIEYTPYMVSRNFKLLFYLYCVDGVEFGIVQNENGDEELENILSAVANDGEVSMIFDQFTAGQYADTLIEKQLNIIVENARDMVEYRKQQLLHNRDDEISRFINNLSIIAEKLSSIDLSKFDSKVLSQIFLTSLLKSGTPKEKLQEIANVINPQEKE